MKNLLELSAEKLEELAANAQRVAADLRLQEPSDNLCIEAGIIDCSYDTQCNGYVPSFSGEVVVTVENGSKWRCVGRNPKGSASYIDTDGFIEKTKIN